MEINVVNIAEKFSKVTEQHKYKAIARMNNYLFKVVRMQREFIWHSHDETDEVFFLVDGELTIELLDKTLVLHAGELVSIPAGVEHKPSAEQECLIMLIEPETTVNTGNAGGVLTDNEVVWI